MKILPVVIGIVAVIVIFVLGGALYTVHETETVILTQFGRAVGEPVLEPGLHFKTPFVQDVNRLEKRILEWDGDPSEMPTKDKMYISVDTFARWRISDPKTYFEKLGSERRAMSRLDDIIGSEVRTAVAGHELIEVVRSNKDRELPPNPTAEGTTASVQQKATRGRMALQKDILAAAAPKLTDLGIQLLDIRIKRVNYNQDVARNIYQRMISERQQIAQRFRSEGEGEAARINGRRGRDLLKVESEAYKRVQELQGEADAEASRIYAEAYNQSTEAQDFYGFLKTLDTYRTILGRQTSMILSTDSELFELLERSKSSTNRTMDRRSFLVSGAAAVAATSLGQDPKPTPTPKPAAKPADGPKQKKPDAKPFQLLYAPHFDMFSNHAKTLEDQLQFAADNGFRAWEDNGMANKDEATQRQLAAKMEKCGMQMGVFVAHGDFNNATFASGDKDHQKRVLADIDKACTVAGRVNAKWCTVVPGAIDPRKDAGYQFANTVELLKRCCDKIEQNKSELVMVLEPLNFLNHPNLYLTKMAQGFAICRAVGSPHCKILDDLYHQQITEGNLIHNIDQSWSEIAYFQVGDNPGRKEPYTGEINYNNVFRHIHKKGFKGIVGMEHGKSQGGKDGELKLIKAYRDADAF